ncbi:MAG: hypothetical protein ACKPKO_43970, partial [Candidatus Fonsibacter sp.]
MTGLTRTAQTRPVSGGRVAAGADGVDPGPAADATAGDPEFDEELEADAEYEARETAHASQLVESSAQRLIANLVQLVLKPANKLALVALLK